MGVMHTDDVPVFYVFQYLLDNVSNLTGVLVTAVQRPQDDGEIAVFLDGLIHGTVRRPEKVGGSSRELFDDLIPVSYTHLTLPTKLEV